MADVEAKVKEIIMNKLGVEASQVTHEASFTNDLGADSLDTVELVMDAVLPTQLDSNSAPAALEWVYLDQAARTAKARGLIKGRTIGPIRIALPQNSGARLLFAAIAADWRKIGVTAQSVAITAPADLRLIDEVAPQSAALWYLQRLSCAHGLPCDPVMETALKAALTATTSKERGDAIVEVDAKLAQRQVFIPIALPLRWSLVSANLVGWRGNAFAVHPLTTTLRNN